MQLTIDTETDTYEQTIAAVQAAYGLRPVAPGDWPPRTVVVVLARFGPHGVG